MTRPLPDPPPTKGGGIAPGRSFRSPGGGDAPASRSGAIAKLRNEREKLLGLFLDEKITNDFFAEKERSITAKIDGLEADHAEALESVRQTNALAEAFERAAALLRDPGFDFDALWGHANDKERRILIEELIESVAIYADRLEVTVTGAPPLLVTLDEVGLRSPGTGSLVSEDRRHRSQRLGGSPDEPVLVIKPPHRSGQMMTRTGFGVGGGT